MSSKQAAGNKAATLVQDGMVLGLGTGSTVACFLSALALRVRAEGLTVKGVPSSEATAAQARELGLELTDLETDPHLDLAVDGADEVDPEFRLVKGGGGALLREKIVAQAAREVVIIVGEGKRVERLATSFLLPVEILPFGHTATRALVAEAGGCQPFLRTCEDGSPFLTDNGNYILDCKFPQGIERPEALHAALCQIPGVAEVGLFLDLCHVLIEGRSDGSALLVRRS
ncbi:MAG: ribose 5-phosphate isomerase A [Planctomycetota bacterium]|nr:MAG: ribose 5-phosphate isomerase A [Planctomycetota bacterium]